jgi:uncharacterized protein (UPF0332 family)
MGSNMLLEKSLENKNTADWAEKQEYYDVAISRLYYSMYQKIISIANKREYKIVKKKGKGSHYHFINDFIIKAKEESVVEPTDCIYLYKINALRELRNTSDYDNVKIEDEDEFKMNFKSYYIKIDQVLCRLI